MLSIFHAQMATDSSCWIHVFALHSAICFEAISRSLQSQRHEILHDRMIVYTLNLTEGKDNEKEIRFLREIGARESVRRLREAA